MIWILLTLFLVAAITAGVAVSYIAGASAVLAFIALDQARFLAVLPQRVFSQLDVFTFLAMPLFILAGEAMNRGGVTRILINFALLLVGRFKGGLGYVNITTSVFIAGISGSAVADAAATSNTLVPAMKEKGYKADFAAALTAASCVIGPIIPPSIAMIFYGAIMNVSVAAMFAGGIIPGLLVALFLFAYNFWIAQRDDHPGGSNATLPPVRETLLKAIPALAIPITVAGGIIFGFVTPTEAAAIAVLIAVTLIYVYGRLDGAPNKCALGETKRICSDALERSVTLTGSIFILLVAAAVFGYLMAILQVPEAISVIVTEVGLPPVGYLLLASAVLFIAGMFLDISMALVLLVPVLIPTAIAGGADPVHVGVISCLNLTLGLISPPFGGCLMVISATTGVSYARLSLAILPFLAVEVLLLIILILLPEITLALPRALGLLSQL